MGGKTFDLIGTISDLLRRIDEGRKITKETQSVRDEFSRTCAERDNAHRLLQKLQLKMISPEEPAKSEVKAEFDRQVSEHKQLSDKSDNQWLQFKETTAFIDPFGRDVLLLLEQLPLKVEWDVYRQAVGGLNVGAADSWRDPPTDSALETLETRLREMLDLAGGTRQGQVPRSQPSRRSRGPNLDISRRRIELEDALRTELATVVLELQQPTDLSKLRKKFPAFHIWQQLSVPEQESLLREPLKITAYARKLVLRHFGLTSEETLKKDRKKLRAAANQHPVGQ